MAFSRFLTLAAVLSAYSFSTLVEAAFDPDGDQLSDIWEAIFEAQNLPAAVDADGDGFSNAIEALSGTDPLNVLSRPEIEVSQSGPLSLSANWLSAAGKIYRILSSDTLDSWAPMATIEGTGQPLSLPVATDGTQRFFRLELSDVDSDADGLNNWEERMLGFEPASAHSERLDTPDFNRLATAWNASSTITVGLLDGEVSERWPDPGVVAIRRTGGMKPVTVNFALTGTATRTVDYAPSSVDDTITIPAGSREVWVQFTPVADDDDSEGDETITLTVQPGSGYLLGAPAAALTATAVLHNEPSGALPSAKAAARFLVQAAFGPDQDSPADADDIPETVEQVMQTGFAGWLDQQFAINPPGYLEPFVEHSNQLQEFYTDSKEAAWWNRALGAPLLWYPNGPPQPHDPLRQRMAFALSQIFVVSDRPETLAVEPRALANFYDLFERHAFGNFRDLLIDVTMHPVMGFYLSVIFNRKPDPANNLFPDENYAREVMQLFTIGLWELNLDGTKKLDASNRPIATYDNNTITNFARVFTGLGVAGSGQFMVYIDNWLEPMKLWDQWHDLEPKTLLNGTVTPQRTASNPDTGAAALADINAAIDNLFQHPNVGPFIGYRLIQRFVTSNPSSGYVGRVAATFNDNGFGVRGDLQAVLRSVLLDPEARNPAKLSDPHWGKLREPFLKFVNFARAFNATTQAGFYSLDAFFLDHQQEPLKSPSVFNFFLPTYSPQGSITAAGIVAPEFQIINASTAIAAPNHYFNALSGRDLHRWGTGDSTRATRPNLVQEEALAQTDVDALIRRLDLVLTGGALEPRNFQLIRDAVLRIQSFNYEWEKERVNLAAYLIVTSPEFAVLR